MVSVDVYVEGPTEWYVARKLYKKGVLSEGKFLPDRDQPMIIGDVVSSLDKLVDPNNEGKTGILINPANKILLMYDQEKLATPSVVISKIEDRLNEFDIDYNIQQHTEFTNVFIGKISIEERDNSFAIHVADKLFCRNDNNKDFDGYILELLKNENGLSIVKQILTDNKIIKISKLRKSIENEPDLAEKVKKLGEIDIPSLIESNSENKWQILRSKTFLYSYITALQIGKSHVWFCEKVIDKADDGNLRHIFSSLIAAWNELCRGG